MKTILLVEDEENLVNVMEPVLRDEGYEVKKAFTAEEAFQILTQWVPDLMICDVKMAGMDGFTMIEELRKVEKLSGVPFVFLTAFDHEAGRKKGMALGAKAYVTKPFDVDELVKLVKRILPIS